MRLKSIELSGFKSFARKTELKFDAAITAVVGPNGSGKSNVAEAFRFVLGEQSMKSMRGKRGEDLIWNGSPALGRAGRASAKLVFDNTDRALDLDFDEVSIERVVHRDGGNDYILNGSTVRLRDVTGLLAQANIGASGHHIISQGEADRILSASPRDRREMVEDALGLTAYLYKREDAQRKLEKTADNIREVELLRRELAPHLKFLAGQVKKIEEAEKLRSELAELYLEYLKRESVYLKLCEADLKALHDTPLQEKEEIERTIHAIRQALGKKGESDKASQELMHLEEEGRTLSHKRDGAVRELGRIEGSISALEHAHTEAAASVSAEDASKFASRVEEEIEAVMSLEGENLKRRLSALLVLAKEFLRRIARPDEGRNAKSLKDLREKKAALEKELNEMRSQEDEVIKSVDALRRSIESEKDASREAERELFAAMARRSELEGQIAAARAKKEQYARERELFVEELREAGVLIGREAFSHETFAIREGGHVLSEMDIAAEERGMQETRRRKIERLKIRLEESGAGNAEDVLKEHRETRERDEFLSKELADLAHSAESLKNLIADLTQTLENRFEDGVKKINEQFDAFFKLMFGGGSASLSLIQERKTRPVLRSADEEEFESGDESSEEETFEEGIDIGVHLPHKRIKGLHMLSGGERALTSIALIFAMSQVNPPPFLTLDETDAALDEANSRRYGDMIDNLSRSSQLILITHNRETMSRAGVLYGITMGADGVSKMLSVKFEEAVAVAK